MRTIMIAALAALLAVPTPAHAGNDLLPFLGGVFTGWIGNSIANQHRHHYQQRPQTYYVPQQQVVLVPRPHVQHVVPPVRYTQGPTTYHPGSSTYQGCRVTMNGRTFFRTDIPEGACR